MAQMEEDDVDEFLKEFGEQGLGTERICTPWN
jgi:hypothetical protein